MDGNEDVEHQGIKTNSKIGRVCRRECVRFIFVHYRLLNIKMCFRSIRISANLPEVDVDKRRGILICAGLSLLALTTANVRNSAEIH